MRIRLRPLLAGLLLALAGPGAARAQPAPADRSPEPSAPSLDPSTSPDVDAELRRMAEAQASGEPGAEVVEIFDARPKQPIERGTEVRLSYEQLAARGATDLASALRLLPDVAVRDAGRGGFNVDIRGGRKGAVTVLIDGMAVTDPYYGTFDVSSIPITDIVQIRLSPTPQSPLDGPGGPGGVIEVLTRDAIGKQMVIARLTGDSLPTFGATGMARAALSQRLALRVSMSGEAGARDQPVGGGVTLGEDRHAATGSTRLEYRRGPRRLALDGFLDSRHYIAPPSDIGGSDVIMIDRELSARASAKGDDEIGALQLQGQAYAHYLARRARHFSDATLEVQTSDEDLVATRAGGAAIAARPLGRRGRWSASVVGSHERARVVADRGEGAAVAEGDVTLIEAAADLKYETTRWQLDGAVGAVLPFGVGAAPWPEAKLVGKLAPRKDLELVATGGYKGRVPTLRERFDPQSGNPELEPEKSWHAELRVIERLGERLRVEVAPFYRRTTGIIRLVADPARPDVPNAMISDNIDLVRFLGVDTQARLRLHRMFEVGGSYNYIRARGDSADPNLDPNLRMYPLDRLPAHRADGWVQVTPDPRISMLARVRYFGDSRDKGQEVAGYTTFEATITAPITKQYLAVLRIDDVTDVRPETRKGYHTAGRIVSLMVQGTWE